MKVIHGHRSLLAPGTSCKLGRGEGKYEEFLQLLEAIEVQSASRILQPRQWQRKLKSSVENKFVSMAQVIEIWKAFDLLSENGFDLLSENTN